MLIVVHLKKTFFYVLLLKIRFIIFDFFQLLKSIVHKPTHCSAVLGTIKAKNFLSHLFLPFHCLLIFAHLFPYSVQFANRPLHFGSRVLFNVFAPSSYWYDHFAGVGRVMPALHITRCKLIFSIGNGSIWQQSGQVKQRKQPVSQSESVSVCQIGRSLSLFVFPFFLTFYQHSHYFDKIQFHPWDLPSAAPAPSSLSFFSFFHPLRALFIKIESIHFKGHSSQGHTVRENSGRQSKCK